MIIIEYILGSLFKFSFFIVLLIFHAIQVLAYNIFGYNAQQKAIYGLNRAILFCFRLAGTKISFIDNYKPAPEQPLIVIANHQSMWDIVGLYWFLRKYRPLFVSKIEIAKGVPSISYNLRKSGSALIDRKDRKQAISEIMRVGEKAYREKRSIIIFPEGTRSRKNSMKEFSLGGISGLVKKMPAAMILPICIKGTGELEATTNRIKAFKSISWTVLQPFSGQHLTPQEISDQAYQLISEELSKTN